MIKQEKYICNNGVEQIHTYSDEGYFIIQKETNLKFAEAFDNIPVIFTYEETDEKIEKDEIIETK